MVVRYWIRPSSVAVAKCDPSGAQTTKGSAAFMEYMVANQHHAMRADGFRRKREGVGFIGLTSLPKDSGAKVTENLRRRRTDSFRESMEMRRKQQNTGQLWRRIDSAGSKPAAGTQCRPIRQEKMP